MKEDGDQGPLGIDRWAEALTWHSTLREVKEDDLTNALARDWNSWYADAENQHVFDDVSRLLGDRDLYHNRVRPSRALLEADRYDPSTPVAKWRETQARRVTREERASAGSWWHWLSGGMAVATVVATVLVIRWPLRFWSGTELSAPVSYQTTVGELKAIQLRDGSSITLGGQTELSVALSAHRRSVKLIEGQAWFKIAHDPHSPFIVTAGDGMITDVGTAFVVTRDSDRVVVMVTDGAVEVTRRLPMRPPSLSDKYPGRISPPAPIRVSRGEELAVSDDGPLGSVTQTDTQAAIAWTSGRLVFDDEPLRYVIEAVNRYSWRHITVSTSAGALRFSGIVFQDEIGDWLQGLARIFPVTIDQRGAAICVHLSGSKPRRGLAEASCTAPP